MLLDWFTHLDGTILCGGVVTDRYLAWHPLDHIRWELARPALGGGPGEGARFLIVDQFGGRPEYRIDVVCQPKKFLRPLGSVGHIRDGLGHDFVRGGRTGVVSSRRALVNDLRSCEPFTRAPDRRVS